MTEREALALNLEAMRKTYKGREILYPTSLQRRKIFVAGRPVSWGTVGALYYLNVYAYDPGKTLEEVVHRYIDYLEKVSSTGKGKV